MIVSKKLLFTTIIFFLFTASNITAQDQPPEPKPDTSVFKADSSKVPDSTFFKLPPIKKKEKIDTTRLEYFYDFDDSVRQAFLIDRLNIKDDAARSNQHDAGDYLRFSPSNFIIDYQEIPFRKTVSPFTLPGNRMNIILNGRNLAPFEHLPEPDNMTDLNSIPTAPVQDIYNIEGPLGMIFGGQNSSSSLILVPHQPEGTRAESKMMVDKGWNGYAYTKGLFTHRNRKGRSIRLAVGYRKSDGTYFNSDDDGYNQWGEIIAPITSNVRLDLNGHLYKNDGGYRHRPAISENYFDRFRRNLDISSGLRLAHDAGKTTGIEFRHKRSESNIDLFQKPYYRHIDLSDNTISLYHQRKMGRSALKAGLSLTEGKYEDRSLSNKRRRGTVDFEYLAAHGETAFLMYIKGEKVKGYDPAPSGMFAFTNNGEKTFFSGSVGYSTRFPSQYELDLVPAAGGLVVDFGEDYLESGNPDLEPEKQLIGNLTFALGRTGRDLRLSVTGGRIRDGIDWKKFDNPLYTQGEYRPVNRDIDFVTGTVQKKLTLGSLIYWSGGASYHYLKIDGDNDPPYSPDYQAFSSLELYYHIKKFDVHLYAYGEAVYNDIYSGYNGQEYGRDMILNIKFTFRIKKFRFYYISQNVPGTDYYSREDYLYVDRFNYYGVTWEFWD